VNIQLQGIYPVNPQHLFTEPNKILAAIVRAIPVPLIPKVSDCVNFIVLGRRLSQYRFFDYFPGIFPVFQEKRSLPEG
jgi:hypothetical protein